MATFDDAVPESVSEAVWIEQRKARKPRDYAAERARARARAQAARAPNGEARRKVGQNKGIQAAQKLRMQQRREKAASQGMSVAQWERWKKQVDSAIMAVFNRTTKQYRPARLAVEAVLANRPEFTRQVEFNKDELVKLAAARVQKIEAGRKGGLMRQSKRRTGPKRRLKQMIEEDEDDAVRANGTQPTRRKRRAKPQPETARSNAGRPDTDTHDDDQEHRTRAEEKHVSYAFGHVEEWLTQYARGANISWPALAGGVAELLSSTISR